MLLHSNSFIDVCAKCARLATVVARIGGAAEPFLRVVKLCFTSRRNEAVAEPRIAWFLAGLAPEPVEGAGPAKKPPKTKMKNSTFDLRVNYD